MSNPTVVEALEGSLLVANENQPLAWAKIMLEAAIQPVSFAEFIRHPQCKVSDISEVQPCYDSINACYISAEQGNRAHLKITTAATLNRWWNPIA